MRLIKSLGIVTLVMLIVTGILGTHYWPIESLDNLTKEKIEKIISKFTELNKPIAEFSMDNRTPEMFDPQSKLPRSHLYDRKYLANLVNFANTCNGESLIKGDFKLKKTLEWHRFLCKRIKFLSKSFFSTPPYFHPSGNSFVFLAIRSGLESFQNRRWIKEHIRFLHISELRYVHKYGVKIDSGDLTISKLSLDEFKQLFLKEPIVETKKNIIVRKEKLDKNSVIRPYLIYDTKNWKSFLDDEWVESVNTSGYLCNIKYGNMCWRKKQGYIENVKKILFVVLLLTLSSLSIFIIFFAVKSIRGRVRYHKDREYALQTMAHELRTPVTNLNLITESFRSIFDELSKEGQKTFLDLCNEVQRLNRLAISSENYLSISKEAGLVSQVQHIESVNDYIEKILKPYGNILEVTKLTEDISIETDPQWLSICLLNLVENAIKHGKPPIEMRLDFDSKYLKFIVRNQGEVEIKRIDLLIKPFVKQKISQGLGLGLSITHRAVGILKGKLEFEPSPPTFTISLRR